MGPPCENHENAYEGKIGVAVSHLRPQAGLNDAEERYEHTDKPKPPRDEIGGFLGQSQCQAGDDQKTEDRTCRFHGGDSLWIGIQHAQIVGPEQFAQIFHIRDKCIIDTEAHRCSSERGECCMLGLHQQPRTQGNQGKAKQWHLFTDESQDGYTLQADALT